jgi:hypothetical protein
VCCNAQVDVRAVVTGVPIVPPLAPPGSKHVAAAGPKDSVAPSLQLLATPEIRHLLESIDRHRLSAVASHPAHHTPEIARTEAVRSLASAALVVDAAIKHPPQMDGPAVLAVAERLIESGQLANYYRAADLSRAVGGAYAPVKRGPKKILLLRTLWRRAPLLVLLMGWLLLGLAAPSVEFGFELWGVGFLALVVFQFYVTTRKR